MAETWDADPAFAVIMRRSSENHEEVGPACDDRCVRWGDRAHGHLCPDGLYDPTPFLTLTTWCSCGVRLGLVRYDVARPMAAAVVADFGRKNGEAFRDHMLLAHSIDVERDEDWLRRLADTAMTRDEFAQGWAERSGRTVEQVLAMGYRPATCQCGWKGCEGWQMVRLDYYEDMERLNILLPREAATLAEIRSQP